MAETDRYPVEPSLDARVIRYASTSLSEKFEWPPADVAAQRTFTDRTSGDDVSRPQLEAMLSYLRKGDVVVCQSVDRLARNSHDLQTLLLALTTRGVHVNFVKEGLTFTAEGTSVMTLPLDVMKALARFERELWLRRPREGAEQAKLAGVYRGRKCSLSIERSVELRQRCADGENKTALAREFGVDRTTVYRYAKRQEPRALRRPAKDEVGFEPCREDLTASGEHQV